MNGPDLEQDTIVVRPLRAEDLDAVVSLDAKNVGRRRDEYFRTKLKRNLSETGIQVSLAAELEACFAGFLLARVYYGEFGTLEPVAVLDTLGVHPDFRHRGIGTALIDQLSKNLRALGIARIRTEVDWEEQDLLGFFHHEGFRPAPRICLERDLEGP